MPRITTWAPHYTKRLQVAMLPSKCFSIGERTQMQSARRDLSWRLSSNSVCLLLLGCSCDVAQIQAIRSRQIHHLRSPCTMHARAIKIVVSFSIYFSPKGQMSMRLGALRRCLFSLKIGVLLISIPTG